MNSVQPIEAAEIKAQPGPSPKQIADEICNVINKAEKIYMETRNRKVVISEEIRVTLPLIRACQFCDHKTFVEGVYKIKNLKTNEKIVIDRFTYHQLKKHSFFGIGKYQLNPINACKILGLK